MEKLLKFLEQILLFFKSNVSENIYDVNLISFISYFNTYIFLLKNINNLNIIV